MSDTKPNRPGDETAAKSAADQARERAKAQAAPQNIQAKPEQKPPGGDGAADLGARERALAEREAAFQERERLAGEREAAFQEAQQEQERQRTAGLAGARDADDGTKVAASRDEALPGDVVSFSSADYNRLLARIAQLEQGRAPGQEGQQAGEAKSTLLLPPGAGVSPAHALPAGGSSITSAPDGQPRAVTYPVRGADALSGVVKAPHVEVRNARILLTAPVYVGDAIRNESEVLEGYTGPLGKAMVPVDAGGRKVDPSHYA